MQNLQDLLAWWNLIFLLPFATAVGYLLLVALGGLHFDHDVEMDHDHDLDGEADNLFLQTLGILGVGKVPLSMILMSFCLIWGFVGWVCNEGFSQILPAPWFVVASVVTTFVVTLACTRVVASTVGRIFPSTESYGSTHQDLVGKLAAVRFTLTEGSRGSATLYDNHKTFLEVPCRLMDGEEPISSGEQVILCAFDEDAAVFEVCRAPQLSE